MSKKNAKFTIQDVMPLCGKPAAFKKFIECINPEHNERKHDNCYVRRHRFQCFSCGVKGDATEFIRIVQGFKTRREAFLFICDGLGIPVPDKKERRVEDEARELKIQGLEVFYGWSLKAPEPAYEHLEQRGIPRELAQQYGVGFIKNVAFDDLLSQSPEEKRADIRQTFEELGLLSNKGNLLFANRLIIPLFKDGRIVELIGRTIKPDDFRPKYIFDKTTEPKLPETCWNLDECYEESEVYMTEGAIDGLSLIQQGILNVVAIAGIQGLTKGKLRALRHTPKSRKSRWFLTLTRTKPARMHSLILEKNSYWLDTQ